MVAAIETPPEMPKSGEDSLRARQKNDPELKQIIDYLEKGSLPEQQQKAKELALSKSQYVVVSGVLHRVEKDKTLRIIPPETDRKQLFEEAHGVCSVVTLEIRRYMGN